MSDQPCQNPNCHSFGKPHPNCECYVNMAEGGEITPSMFEMPQTPPEDPNHAVSGFLVKHGATGLLNQNLMNDPEKYQASVQAGHKRLDNYVTSLFANERMPAMDHSKSKKTLEDWMEKGGITHDIQQALYEQHQPSVQSFAHGGKVEAQPLDNAVASTHPAQNMLLNAAKGRVSEYLNSQKPQKNTPKLAFDHEPDHTEQEKIYEKAKDLAVHPLGILDHVQDGSVSPVHMKHFNSMYPELNETVQKRLTKEITKGQLEGTKPPYHVRQGLSLFMGNPLSSEFTPQNIQAAQATFMPTGPATSTASGSQSSTQKPGGKAKGSKSALTKSDQAFLTSGQATESRQQSQH